MSRIRLIWGGGGSPADGWPGKGEGEKEGQKEEWNRDIHHESYLNTVKMSQTSIHHLPLYHLMVVEGLELIPVYSY